MSSDKPSLFAYITVVQVLFEFRSIRPSGNGEIEKIFYSNNIRLLAQYTAQNSFQSSSLEDKIDLPKMRKEKIR